VIIVIILHKEIKSIESYLLSITYKAVCQLVLYRVNLFNDIFAFTPRSYFHF